MNDGTSEKLFLIDFFYFLVNTSKISQVDSLLFFSQLLQCCQMEPRDVAWRSTSIAYTTYLYKQVDYWSLSSPILLIITIHKRERKRERERKKAIQKERDRETDTESVCKEMTPWSFKYLQEVDANIYLLNMDRIWKNVRLFVLFGGGNRVKNKCLEKTWRMKDLCLLNFYWHQCFDGERKKNSYFSQ